MGVIGMSSDISEAVVVVLVVLIGVLKTDVDVRVGVAGRERWECLLKRPPSS